jgi:hypothetical protein
MSYSSLNKYSITHIAHGNFYNYPSEYISFTQLVIWMGQFFNILDSFDISS